MIYEKFIEQGCKPDHKIKLVSRIHTEPPQFKYKCTDCENTVVSRKLIV